MINEKHAPVGGNLHRPSCGHSVMKVITLRPMKGKTDLKQTDSNLLVNLHCSGWWFWPRQMCAGLPDLPPLHQRQTKEKKNSVISFMNISNRNHFRHSSSSFFRKAGVGLSSEVMITFRVMMNSQNDKNVSKRTEKLFTVSECRDADGLAPPPLICKSLICKEMQMNANYDQEPK